ncbi:unknown [Crocosphaera subtropica ATCC 51142]|uniref:Putative restriction endonuclease domain-containing protein n=1 Tax=Crocosphaera subtropica (strain ATCC 51142 / BH68) TaxID=43989 RepID=B1WUW5_CROS5|nr:Uma2 family endonuclease [Crocosphaera subtropica]ACB50566.1 unknown [Crocosphaera subtropica ATCC 51142]
MVTQLKNESTSNIIYPDSDGKPMADNTLQFRWITMIKENLDWLFADDNNVFVAGDLLWYPIEGNNKKRLAPDIMVVCGRPKGERGPYQQWKEDNIAPQIVFEILSPGNTQTEMSRKLLFYERYGVEEYYIYGPHKNELSGLLRGDEGLDIIDNMDGWKSPRLGIRFEIAEPELKLYYPDGDSFSTYIEERKKVQQEKQRADKLAAKLKELGIDPDEL